MTDEFNFLTEKFIAAHFKATAIKVIPTIFPWRWMGCTDEEFMSTKLNYSSGPPLPEDKRRILLGVVRQQETVLKERRDKVTGSKPKPKSKQVQLELW
jgi:hypothetical protein